MECALCSNPLRSIHQEYFDGNKVIQLCDNCIWPLRQKIKESRIKVIYDELDKVGRRDHIEERDTYDIRIREDLDAR